MAGTRSRSVTEQGYLILAALAGNSGFVHFLGMPKGPRLWQWLIKLTKPLESGSAEGTHNHL